LVRISGSPEEQTEKFISGGWGKNLKEKEVVGIQSSAHCMDSVFSYVYSTEDDYS
jgi:hypothetical protein